MKYKDDENKVVYGYDELRTMENDWWNSLSDGEQHQMIQQNDVIFESYVLSHTKPGDVIEIDYNDFTFEIIGQYE
jgi:hypothetical protein